MRDEYEGIDEMGVATFVDYEDVGLCIPAREMTLAVSKKNEK